MSAKARRPLGPHPLHTDGRSVFCPVRAADGSFAWARIDADHYRAFMARVWRLDREGYPTCTVYDVAKKKGIHVSLHRMVTNAPAGAVVDHRNGNRLDARRCMLRFATFSQNSANRRADRRRKAATLSRYRGVTLHKGGKWQAQAKRNDRFVYGGLHATQEAAALAYNAMAKKLWGRFARLNRIRKVRQPGRCAQRLAA